MKVLKFGGASIKDAAAVRNMVEIIKNHIGFELVIVVSAMGKTTNTLEKIVEDFFYSDADIHVLTQSLKSFHIEIIDDLFGRNTNHRVYQDLQEILERIKNNSLKIKRAGAAFDFLYDQIISEGEMISSVIISHFMNDSGIYTKLLDARALIKTNNEYRDASVNWPETEEKLKGAVTFSDNNVYLIQGFIGSCGDNHNTTLGREGSDFTAAIVGNVLDAKEVIIWKDVPGLLNADPKYFSNTKKLNNISYHEAVELAYYGATVIHPKTIKPLQNKGIPLVVRSFKDSNANGSLINENSSEDSLIPSYIFRTKQVLFSIFTRDYSFIDEKLLAELFAIFARHHIKINLMENSAIGFTTCFEQDDKKLKALTDELSVKYKVLYNKDVELMTIRHYDQATLDQLVLNKEVLVDQRSRHTARLVMQNQAQKN